jgi:hypothetical protein
MQKAASVPARLSCKPPAAASLLLPLVPAAGPPDGASVWVTVGTRWCAIVVKDGAGCAQWRVVSLQDGGVRRERTGAAREQGLKTRCSQAAF